MRILLSVLVFIKITIKEYGEGKYNVARIIEGNGMVEGRGEIRAGMMGRNQFGGCLLETNHSETRPGEKSLRKEYLDKVQRKREEYLSVLGYSNS